MLYVLYVLYVLNPVWQCGNDDGDDGEGFVCIDGNGVDEGRRCWSAGAGGADGEQEQRPEGHSERTKSPGGGI